MAEIFVRKTNGKVLGPIQSSQLKGMITAKSLTPEDALSKSKDGPWKTAANVKGLVFPQMEKRTQTDHPKTRANKANTNSNSDTLVLSGESIKVLKYAHILNGNLYYVDCQPDTLTFSRQSIDSTHLVKAHIINPTQLELYWLRLLAAWCCIPVGLILFAPALFWMSGPPGSSNANNMVESLKNSFIWITLGFAAWITCIVALIVLYFKLAFKKKYSFVLKLNTSAKHTFIPFATREEGEKAVELLTSG